MQWLYSAPSSVLADRKPVSSVDSSASATQPMIKVSMLFRAVALPVLHDSDKEPFISVPHLLPCHLLVTCPLWMTKILPPRTPQSDPPWRLWNCSSSQFHYDADQRRHSLRETLVFRHIYLTRGQWTPVLLWDPACPSIRYQYGFCSFVSRGQRKATPSYIFSTGQPCIGLHFVERIHK